jgi:hypothetical protein
VGDGAPHYSQVRSEQLIHSCACDIEAIDAANLSEVTVHAVTSFFFLRPPEVLVAIGIGGDL